MLIFRFGKIYGEDADQRPAANDQNPEYSFITLGQQGRVPQRRRSRAPD